LITKPESYELTDSKSRFGNESLHVVGRKIGLLASSPLKQTKVRILEYWNEKK